MFISDEPFLLPTLHAALQVAAQPEVVRKADILIYLTNIDSGLVRSLRASLVGTPLHLLELHPSVYAIPPGTTFNPTHVPRTTLARLSMGSLIPEQYEHIVYLDGDIHVVGDLSPLVNYNVAPGRIAAASEAAWIYEGDLGRYWPFTKAYLRGLGIHRPSDYFNAGVMTFRRDTWEIFAPQAKQFFFDNSARCLYHDQSALNAVFLGRRDVLSPRWNFVSGYAMNATLDIDRLKIIHFTGADKPWNTTGPPWNGRFRNSYLELLTRFPVLQPLEGCLAVKERSDPQRPQSQRRRPSLPWRPFFRNRRIQRYLRSARFALP